MLTMLMKLPNFQLQSESEMEIMKIAENCKPVTSENLMSYQNITFIYIL